MNTSINLSLRLLLFLAIMSESSQCFADLFNDQFNHLKAQKNKAQVELNQKYSILLAALLEKVKANKDEAMAINIRQEMSDVGFPHKDDWVLGEWEVNDSDNIRRTYVFTANGVVTHTRWDHGWAPDFGMKGVYSKEPDGSYRVIIRNILLFVSQAPRGGIVVTRWHDIKDYPNKSKSITGTAKR